MKTSTKFLLLKKLLLIIFLLFLTATPEAGMLDWSRLVIEYPPQIDISLLKGHKIFCGTSHGNYTMEFDLPRPGMVLMLKDKMNITGTYYCITKGYFEGGVLHRQSSNEVQFFLDYRVPTQPDFVL